MSVKTKCNIPLFVLSVLVSLAVLADTCLAHAENCIPLTTSLNAVPHLLAQAQRPQPNETLGIVLVLGLCFGLVFAPVYYFYIRPRLKRDARDAGTPRSIPSISLQEAISVVLLLCGVGVCAAMYPDTKTESGRRVVAAVGVGCMVAAWGYLYRLMTGRNSIARGVANDPGVQISASTVATDPSSRPAVQRAVPEAVTASSTAVTPANDGWQIFARNAFIAGSVAMFILEFAPALVMSGPLGVGFTYVSVVDELVECIRKGDGAGVAIFGFLIATPLLLAVLALKSKTRGVYIVGGAIGLICLILSVSTYRLPFFMAAYPATLFMFQIASAGLLCGFFVKPNLLLPRN